VVGSFIKYTIFWSVLIFAAIYFIGFASNNELAGLNKAKEHLAGFWVGLVHGFLSIIALVVSIFNRSINIYEIYNSGFGYNAGFIIGIMFWINSYRLHRAYDNRARNSDVVDKT